MNEEQLRLFEQFNILPPETSQATKSKFIDAANLVSVQLDWLAQNLGFSGTDYWENLDLSIAEKRLILQSAIGSDPTWSYPYKLPREGISKYRFITISSDYTIGGETLPSLYLFEGILYLFELPPNVRIHFTEEPNVLSENINSLEIDDRSCDGYIIVKVKPREDIKNISYYFTDINNIQVGTFGLIELRPYRNITNWSLERIEVKKGTVEDSIIDDGNLWTNALIVNEEPLYPDYQRTDEPPNGFYFVNDRPDIELLDDDFFSSQVFRYDNEYFEAVGIPELIYRHYLFYEFWGIHANKGSTKSLNFLFDALNFHGYNDETLEIENSQLVPSTYTGEFELDREYEINDVFKYKEDEDDPGFYLIVTKPFTATDFLDNYKTGYFKSFKWRIKVLYKMREDTRNDLIPLRLFFLRDLQVATNNKPDHATENPLVADIGYTTSEDSGYYYLRLPLEIKRGDKQFRRAKLLADTYTYYSGENEPKEDIVVGYAYFMADYSASGEAIFEPSQDICKFDPIDPRVSQYLKNNP